MTDRVLAAQPAPAPEAMPLLQARDLACRRGREWLFRGLGFRLSSGQLLWLRGHNGSGKTSLLRMVVGLTPPHAGTLERGLQPGRWGAGAPDLRVVYLGHSNGLKEQLTVTESLRFLAALHGCATDDASVAQALGRLSMQHRRHVLTSALSQGQRRRVALARLALERLPSLWVLDEPFDALDTEGIATVHALLDEHLARGGAVLLTSHVPPDRTRLRVDELHLDAPAAAAGRTP